MRYGWLVVGAVACLGIAARARADSSDGVINTAYDLQQICRQQRSFFPADCAAFINGVNQTYFAISAVNEGFRIICMPPGVTVGQEEQVFEKYAAENPEYLHNSAGSQVLVSLMKVFPCQTSR